MVIYVIYKDGAMLYPTSLPRVVINAVKDGADRVELWRNEKFVKSTASLREYMSIVNPRPSEDDETGGNDYEW